MTGSCLCGSIRYEIDGPLRSVVHCHCSMCRKATGAAFRTRAAVATDSFRWLQGESLLSRYEPSPGNIRTFCSVCGSTLVSLFPGQPDLGLPLGSLDDDPQVKPACHVYVGSKAAWFEITDALPQFVTVPSRR